MKLTEMIGNSNKIHVTVNSKILVLVVCSIALILFVASQFTKERDFLVGIIGVIATVSVGFLFYFLQTGTNRKLEDQTEFINNILLDGQTTIHEIIIQRLDSYLWLEQSVFDGYAEYLEIAEKLFDEDIIITKGFEELGVKAMGKWLAFPINVINLDSDLRELINFLSERISPFRQDAARTHEMNLRLFVTQINSIRDVIGSMINKNVKNVNLLDIKKIADESLVKLNESHLTLMGIKNEYLQKLNELKDRKKGQIKSNYIC